MVGLLLAAFIASLMLSFVLTRITRNVAVRRWWVAEPSRHHIHGRPLPRLGGVAIFVSFVVVVLSLMGLTALLGLETAIQLRTALWVLGPAALIFLLGLYDDLRPLSPYTKFTVQSLGAALLFIGGLGVFQLPGLVGPKASGWIGLPLTIMWVLLITNAFNLIDGIDGLAAGSALFSTLTVLVVSLVNGNLFVSLFTIALAGAILGFLKFNFNPATIFLGDCGSLFVGFLLSALALEGSQKSSTMVAVAIPVVSFGLPILETALSVIRRFLNGQPLFGADRGHIHHKLLERGFSQRQVVIILYGASAACGLLTLFLLYPGGATIGIVLLVLGAGIWLGVQHLGYHEFRELRRVAHRTLEQKQIIINNLAIRRATEQLARAHTIPQLWSILRETFETNDFDAFSLDVAPAAVQSEGLQFGLSWEKPALDARDKKRCPTWKVVLDLVTSEDKRLGSFSLVRSQREHPVLLDVNLLVMQFQVALADAVERTLHRAEDFSSEVGLGHPVAVAAPRADLWTTG